MRAFILLAILTATAGARADWQRDQFAWFFQIDAAAVDKVVGYRTPEGFAVTHLLVGRYREGARSFPGMVLLRCSETQCDGQRVFLGSATAEIEVLGLVDLGEPGPLGERRGKDSPSLGFVQLDHFAHGKKYRWPALEVLESEREPMTTASRFGGEVTGTHRKGELWVISLRAADQGGQKDPVLLRGATEDIYPTGAGADTSYRLVRGGQSGVLDVVASEQRELENTSGCLRPPPVEHRLVLENGRYVRKGSDPYRSSGCH